MYEIIYNIIFKISSFIYDIMYDIIYDFIYDVMFSIWYNIWFAVVPLQLPILPFAAADQKSSLNFQWLIQPMLFQQGLRQFKIFNGTYTASARALFSKNSKWSCKSCWNLCRFSKDLRHQITFITDIISSHTVTITVLEKRRSRKEK